MKTNFIKPDMVRILNSLSIDMVKIPKKNYMMGKYPITIAEYMHFAKDTNSHYPEWYEKELDEYKKMNLGDNTPVIGICWYDAVAYCEWLSQKTGKSYRLPNKEEWEYSAKEGNVHKWKFSKNITAYAWFKQNSNSTNHTVGNKLPNKLGLYDMIGNVWEWTDNARSNEIICGASYNVSLKNSSLSLFDKRDKNYHSKRVGFRILRDYNIAYVEKDISYQCKECEAKYSLNCKELDWLQVGGSERRMGAELEHQAEYFNTCSDCNNEMSITFSCWEYPVGAENMRDVSSSGIINLKGYCCPKLHNEYSEEPTDFDEYLNTQRDIEIDQIERDSLESLEEEFISYDTISYSNLEEKIEELTIFINNLIPFSELEFTYDSEDYSNEKDIPSDKFLISRKFDDIYLTDLVDEIQEDINEAEFALNEDVSNTINDNSLLLKKQYKIEYDDISESYGVDIHCNVYPQNNEKILYIQPSYERKPSADSFRLGQDEYLDFVKAESEMEGWLSEIKGTGYFK